VDAHVIQPHEYDEIPDLSTPEWLERADRAELRHGDKVVRRGRPPMERPKIAINLRLDADVVDGFRATGPGWRTRMNDTLRKALPRLAKAGQ
jgi:uncharacterized protein (DUF4415 family)